MVVRWVNGNVTRTLQEQNQDCHKEGGRISEFHLRKQTEMYTVRLQTNFLAPTAIKTYYLNGNFWGLLNHEFRSNCSIKTLPCV